MASHSSGSFKTHKTHILTYLDDNPGSWTYKGLRQFMIDKHGFRRAESRYHKILGDWDRHQNVKNHEAEWRLSPNDRKYPYHRKKLDQANGQTQVANDKCSTSNGDIQHKRIHGRSIQPYRKMPLLVYSQKRSTRLTPSVNNRFALSSSSLDVIRGSISRTSNFPCQTAEAPCETWSTIAQIPLLQNEDGALAQQLNVTNNLELPFLMDVDEDEHSVQHLDSISIEGATRPHTSYQLILSLFRGHDHRLSPSIPQALHSTPHSIMSPSISRGLMTISVPTHTLQKRILAALTELSRRDCVMYEFLTDLKAHINRFLEAYMEEGHWGGTATVSMSKALMETVDWCFPSSELNRMCLEFAAQLPDMHPFMVMTKVSQAGLLAQRGSVHDAFEVMRPYIRPIKEAVANGPCCEEFAAAAELIAVVLFFMGDEVEGREFLDYLYRRQLPSSRNLVVLGVGFKYMAYGLFEEAEDCFRQVTKRALGDGDKTKLCRTIAFLGCRLCSALRQRPVEADHIQCLRNAVSQVSYLLGDMNNLTIALKYSLFELCAIQQAGETTLAELTNYLNDLRNHYGEWHFFCFDFLDLIAVVQLKLGNPAEAFQILRSTIAKESLNFGELSRHVLHRRILLMRALVDSRHDVEAAIYALTILPLLKAAQILEQERARLLNRLAKPMFALAPRLQAGAGKTALLALFKLTQQSLEFLDDCEASTLESSMWLSLQAWLLGYDFEALDLACVVLRHSRQRFGSEHTWTRLSKQTILRVAQNTTIRNDLGASSKLISQAVQLLNVYGAGEFGEEILYVKLGLARQFDEHGHFRTAIRIRSEIFQIHEQKAFPNICPTITCASNVFEIQGDATNGEHAALPGQASTSSAGSDSSQETEATCVVPLGGTSGHFRCDPTTSFQVALDQISRKLPLLYISIATPIGTSEDFTELLEV